MELNTSVTLDSLYQPPASQQIYKSSPPPQYCGFPIEEYFAKRFPYQSRKAWIAQIKNGDISVNGTAAKTGYVLKAGDRICLLYTSPSPRDRTRSRMPSSA